MRLNKILCVSLSALCLSVNFCNKGANALFGNAHFGIGKKIVKKIGVNLSESNKKAFLSGMVYADIGRFEFDKKSDIESDSYKFADKLKKLAETDEEKWFARGFEIHIFQDVKTKEFLKNILGREYSSYADYMIDCGILESYFVQKSGILYNEFINKFNFEQITDGLNMTELSKKLDIPEEQIKDSTARILGKCSNYPQKTDLAIYDDLIKRTYESFGFEVGLDDIHEQAGNLLGVSQIIPIFIGNKTQVSEELSNKIEEKSDELADMCIAKLNFEEVKNEI